MKFKLELIHKVLLEHSQPMVKVQSVAGFVPQRQSCVAVTETKWPTKPRIFTREPFIEKVG